MLKNKNIRVNIDERDEKLSYKMREAQTKKMPITLVLGDKERDNNLVSYRLYGKSETTTISKEEFVNLVVDTINSKKYNI